MNLGSFLCGHNHHRWVFNGRLYTAHEVAKGKYASFCLRCGKTKGKAS